MDEVLQDVDQDRIKVYLGQVLVHTSGYMEHLDVLKDVLREFRTYNLKVDVEESLFLTNELIFLGNSHLELSQNLAGCNRKRLFTFCISLDVKDG